LTNFAKIPHQSSQASQLISMNTVLSRRVPSGTRFSILDPFSWLLIPKQHTVAKGKIPDYSNFSQSYTSSSPPSSDPQTIQSCAKCPDIFSRPQLHRRSDSLERNSPLLALQLHRCQPPPAKASAQSWHIGAVVHVYTGRRSSRHPMNISPRIAPVHYGNSLQPIGQPAVTTRS